MDGAAGLDTPLLVPFVRILAISRNEHTNTPGSGRITDKPEVIPGASRFSSLYGHTSESSWDNRRVEGVVELGLRKSFKIFAPGSSLRRRVAYSLAIVRLVLVPVIFLAVYYLFRMGLIVDRIVSVDAPVARLAEQASVEMLDARRAERNYFLLRDPEYLKVN